MVLSPSHFFSSMWTKKSGKLQIAALVLNVGGGIAHHVAQHIKADQVGQPEGRHLWPAHGCPGQRVHFLDAEVHLLHQPHDVQRGEGADAIGDEVGRVLGVHHAFAQMQVAEVRDSLQQLGVGFGQWESAPAGACSAAD